MTLEDEPVIPLAVKRAAIAAGVLLLLLIAVLVVRGYFRGQQRQANLARYTEQLTDPDPRQRLAAAELVLDAVPAHESATLTAATALLELREPLRARALLTDVQAELGTELSRRVALLKAEAYFQEARAVIDSMTPQSADMAQQNLDQILERVDELRSVLADQENSTFDRQLLEARALDMRATMLHAMMGREASDLARAQVVAFDEQIEMVGVRVSDLRGQIDTLERRLALLCKTMRQDDPTAQWPRLLLFRSRVRSNQLVEARVLAGQVAATPNLDASVAGEMAWALLNLDHTGMQTSTAEDLALAELLIRQADVSRGQPLPLRQARAIVELRHGRAEEAVESIAQLQRDFPMVMSLNWLLGRALVQANRPAQAVRLLTPLVERTVTAEGRHMLAMALVGVSDYEAAQRELRKSLELDSQNLSARLELARLMMLEGDAAGAEPDIQAATALNPDHPQGRQGSACVCRAPCRRRRHAAAAAGGARRRHAAGRPRLCAASPAEPGRGALGLAGDAGAGVGACRGRVAVAGGRARGGGAHARAGSPASFAGAGPGDRRGAPRRHDRPAERAAGRAGEPDGAAGADAVLPVPAAVGPDRAGPGP
jgi:tetratricopeptide (TPR) repeat protein